MDTNVNVNNNKSNIKDDIKVGDKKVETPVSSTANSATSNTNEKLSTSQNSEPKSNSNSTVIPSNTQNTKECKIRFISKGLIYFEFNKDYVLTLPCSKDFNEKDKTIKISYTSDIGKSDFKYSIIK